MAKFQPAPGRILVAEFEVEKIAEGVFIPDSAKEDMLAGIVVSANTCAWVKEEDRIFFGSYAGMPIRLDGVPFKVMKETEVMGRING